VTSPSSFKSLSIRLRRVQFLVGLGVVAAVGGALVSTALLDWLRPHFEALGPGGVSWLVLTCISRLWILGVLPVLGYGAGRVAEVSPGRTAWVAALTGEGFYLALEWVTSGMEGFLEPGPGLMVRAVTFGVGLVLTQGAVRRGRGDAARAQVKAQAQAEAQRAQYEALLRESQRVAEAREGAARPLGGEEGSAAPGVEEAKPER